jgi:hypothetical protein
MKSIKKALLFSTYLYKPNGGYNKYGGGRFSITLEKIY